MEAFGVRFAVNDIRRFEILEVLYGEVKRDKEAGLFRNSEEWARLVPDDIKHRFSWPTSEQREHWLKVRNSVVTVIPDPSDQLGTEWVFDRVFEAIDEGDYDVVGCEMVGPGIGEMHIDPRYGYPYGGVGPLIALAEAFGFPVLGVNESGKYQPRNELIGGSSEA